MVNRFKLQPRGKDEAPQLRFVEAVKVRTVLRLRREDWKYALLGGFWILVVVKCFLAHWAIVHWDMPFNSAWVWAPTLFAAIICTLLFVVPKED